jgi:uncharacterized repeat protein (TIGR03803 family)
MKKIILTVAMAMAMAFAVTMPSAQAQTFTALHQFDGGFSGGLSDGANPEGALILDAAGNLYGTTFDGGGVDNGIVFKLDPTGVETILLTFNGSNGADPATPLLLDQAGNLYGIADEGPGGAGIIYKLSQQGDQTPLFEFQGSLGRNARGPSGGILMDKSGNFFGTTTAGGAGNCLFGCGSIYRLDSAGKLHVLHFFSDGVGGSLPFGPLVRDSAGNLYGVAEQGGNLSCSEFPQLGCGTVFKLAKNGTFTILHTFQGGADGADPQPGLLMDATGNLFGTALKGGTSENGTIFKIAKDGNYTVLHSFTGKDGANPNGGLVSDAAGNLFGTTQLGGRFHLGTVFELVPAGKLKVLHAFTADLDGASPLAGLTIDAAGHLFGTTVKNGLIQPVQGGNVFEITP